MTESMHCCARLKNAVETPEIPVSFISKFREYGIDVLDGGSSFIQLDYCPWCKKQLEPSMRKEWLNTLESIGIDPFEDEVPAKFLDESWYR